MANTITQTTRVGSGSDNLIVRTIHIVSDGTEETNLVIYDNSAFVADVSKGKLEQIHVMGSFTGAIELAWDQTADANVLSLGQEDSGRHDFRDFGGLANPGAAGATGDLLLTSRALANLDDVFITIFIRQS